MGWLSWLGHAFTPTSPTPHPIYLYVQQTLRAFAFFITYDAQLVEFQQFPTKMSRNPVCYFIYLSLATLRVFLSKSLSSKTIFGSYKISRRHSFPRFESFANKKARGKKCARRVFVLVQRNTAYNSPHHL